MADEMLAQESVPEVDEAEAAKVAEELKTYVAEARAELTGEAEGEAEGAEGEAATKPARTPSEV